MRHFSPDRLRPLKGMGVAAGSVSPKRPARSAGLPCAAEAQYFLLTRTYPARARRVAPSSIFERARRSHPGIASSHGLADILQAAGRAWSELNDNAHVD